MGTRVLLEVIWYIQSLSRFLLTFHKTLNKSAEIGHSDIEGRMSNASTADYGKTS